MNSEMFSRCVAVSGLCLAVGIVSYPAGWDNGEVKRICESDDYNLGNKIQNNTVLFFTNHDILLGNCTVRWAYVLAVVAFFDSIVLGNIIKKY